MKKKTIVSIVIMLVNGSLGTGIAVAGAFSLIRFRSAQGSSKDIATIFLAMAVGLSTGTGYLLFGGIITLLFSIIYITFTLKNKPNENKILKITVPENLEYNQMFDNDKEMNYIISTPEFEISKTYVINDSEYTLTDTYTSFSNSNMFSDKQNMRMPNNGDITNKQKDGNNFVPAN